MSEELTQSFSIEMCGNVLTQVFEKSMRSRLPGAIFRHHELAQVHHALHAKTSANFLIIHLDHRYFFQTVPNLLSIETASELADMISGWLVKNDGFIFINTVAFTPESTVYSDLYEQMSVISEVQRIMLGIAKSSTRVILIDAAAELSRLGYDHAIRERNRYIFQNPYSPPAIDLLVAAYVKGIGSVTRARKKVVVVDADNTLWKGVVGEDGADGIGCDQEYPNVIHYLFQQQLLHLKSLGVLICVVTKNNEADFLEVFARRNIPLTLKDIVSYRSNWSAKSGNIVDIAQELNLGLDSFVFIDDNPLEIDEVSRALPMVTTIQFPIERPELVLGLINSIGSLTARSLTEEDKVRSEQYKVQAARKASISTLGSNQDYIASLEIKIYVGINRTSQRTRVAQLTNKTNQFNLTTRRYSEADIDKITAQGGKVYDFRVVDRFGDLGVVGVVIVVDDRIDTFLMSCRALGREIESQMLWRVCSDCNGQLLTAEYIRTSKNEMVSAFFEENGFVVTSRTELLDTYRQQSGPARVSSVEVIDD